MSIEVLNPDALLSPLADAQPCGPDLVYDMQFSALEQAGAGKPEREYGDKRYPAEPPDWPAVYGHALALAGRTRDLRVAVWLLRSGARLHGLPGAAAALAVVHGLLSRFWLGVHPQLDASDADDPTMRLNALATLAATDAAMADLRSAALAPVRASLTVRDIELGLGHAEPAAGETAPTEAGVRTALQALLAQHPALAQQVAAAHQSAQGIVAELDNRVGSARAPELAPLLRLLALLDEAVAQASAGAADAAADAAQAMAAQGLASAAAPGGLSAIRSRGDAARELGRVCEWIERNEPSNPAPLLIRRAQRLMDKTFLDIIRDLAPDSLGQVERIAGTEASP